MHGEDHPVGYGFFEGVIPEGEYGAGAVVLWDRGTWTPVLEPGPALKKGEMKFHLQGEKLNGRWVLVRIKGDDPKAWLLIKEKDEHARPSAELDIVSARPESVQSGRGLAEVAAERDRLWHSKVVGPGGTVNPGGPAQGAGGAPLPPAAVAGGALGEVGLDERKEVLRRLLESAPPALRFSDHVRGHGSEFFAQARDLGLEGVVSKRAGAPYREGRGGDWRKTKCRLSQEMVIGGFTQTSDGRGSIGALLVGFFEDQQLV